VPTQTNYKIITMPYIKSPDRTYKLNDNSIQHYTELNAELLTAIQNILNEYEIDEITIKTFGRIPSDLLIPSNKKSMFKF
jgi:hypothetical protein